MTAVNYSNLFAITTLNMNTLLNISYGACPVEHHQAGVVPGSEPPQSPPLAVQLPQAVQNQRGTSNNIQVHYGNKIAGRFNRCEHKGRRITTVTMWNQLNKQAVR